MKGRYLYLEKAKDKTTLTIVVSNVATIYFKLYMLCKYILIVQVFTFVFAEILNF